MRILWITSRLLPDACHLIGCAGEVVGGWMQSQLDALRNVYGERNEYFILASDARKCDVKAGNVHHRSFGKGVATYGESVPVDVEAEAKAAIAEFNPDVIHIHGTEFFYGRMSKEVYCDKPVVVSLQGILQGCHPQVGGFLAPEEVFVDQFNLRRVLYGQGIFKEQTKWREKRVPQEELVFKTHMHFMGRTEWDKAWTNALNPVAKYHHVNETLRREFYIRRRDRAKTRPHSIYCSAAAGYPLKGVHFLLRAIAFLANKYPDISLRICAAERLTAKRTLKAILKADQYTSYLRRLIRELGIEKHVVGLPRLSAIEVANELARAETFVLPSLCENSPNSLGEAQLVGTPAIATFVGGIPSVLRNGVDGRLVPCSDPAALAVMIDHYFSNPTAAEVYAKNAREFALVRHDPCRNAQATMRAYEETISG
ncbi:MAG: glycosyltransferase family 4 protein [Kiritimatiellia bacterium]